LPRGHHLLAVQQAAASGFSDRGWLLLPLSPALLLRVLLLLLPWPSPLLLPLPLLLLPLLFFSLLCLLCRHSLLHHCLNDWWRLAKVWMRVQDRHAQLVRIQHVQVVVNEAARYLSQLPHQPSQILKHVICILQALEVEFDADIAAAAAASRVWSSCRLLLLLLLPSNICHTAVAATVVTGSYCGTAAAYAAAVSVLAGNSTGAAAAAAAVAAVTWLRSSCVVGMQLLLWLLFILQHTLQLLLYTKVSRMLLLLLVGGLLLLLLLLLLCTKKTIFLCWPQHLLQLLHGLLHLADQAAAL
jgi:hypothetical protein